MLDTDFLQSASSDLEPYRKKMMANENTTARKIPGTCGACIHRCLFAHSNTSPNKFSFFKRMLGNFSSFLEIPSECANQIRNEAHKDVVLKGSSGHIWHVTLCCNSISASFKDGWEKFVSDNSIEAEDIVVFKHVINMHFLVQIFGSNGYEKQRSFTIENYQLHYLTEGNVAPIYSQKRFEQGEKATDTSVFIENSFDVQRKIKEELGLSWLATGLNEISAKNSITVTEKMCPTTSSSMGKKVQIAKACYQETCIPRHRPVSLNNRVPDRPSRIDAKNVMWPPNTKSHIFGSRVGLCAEHPIILDIKEELNAQVSSTCEHLEATVEACDNSSLEDCQEKSSYCATGVAPMKGVQFSQAPCTETGKQRKFTKYHSSIRHLNMTPEAANSIKTSRPKFAVVAKKSTVCSFWLNIPLSFARHCLPPERINVLLLSSTGEWWVTFVGNRRARGLGPGFKQFVIDNKLEKGDTCIFELVDSVHLIFKVDIFKLSKQDGSVRKKKHRFLDADDKMLNHKFNFQSDKEFSEDQSVTHDEMSCPKRRMRKQEMCPKSEGAN